jgi:putative colanic acid biosynthesis UDP-glucose lipid carrier transferase
MAQLVVHKQGISLAVVTLLQVVVPPAIVVGSLYAITRAFDVHFDDSFQYLAVIAVALAIVLLRSTTTYSEQLLAQSLPLAAGVVLRWLAMVGVLLIIGYATKFSANFSRRVVLTWILVTPLLLILGSLALRAWMRMMLVNPANTRSVVIAGCNDVSLSLADKLQKNSELCMKVEGFFDDRSAERLELPTPVKILGKLPELAAYVRRHTVDVIFIALPIRHLRRVMDLMDDLRDTTASIYYVPDIFVFDLIQARTGEIMGIPVVSMCETPFHGVRAVSKRVTDLVLTTLILVPALPVMLAIALLIRLTSPGPVIFKQRRYGLDGREIKIYKFRSMTVTEDGGTVQQATKQDSRITPLGKYLRRYSLDELPQIFNVLQGSMSLVGPRPHAVAHNEQYRKLIKGYMVRHKVRPGITGLAQVNGCRGETARLEEMQARVNYDLEYLRNWSPLLDLKILVLTVLRLLGDSRAY